VGLENNLLAQFLLGFILFLLLVVFGIVSVFTLDAVDSIFLLPQLFRVQAGRVGDHFVGAVLLFLGTNLAVVGIFNHCVDVDFLAVGHLHFKLFCLQEVNFLVREFQFLDRPEEHYRADNDQIDPAAA
jgi:hypothetical protein